MKKFRIVYQFSHSKFGFQNSITVQERDEIKAIEEAKRQVNLLYDVKPREQKRWTFKDAIQLP